MKQIVVAKDVNYSLNNAGSPVAITNIKEINTLGTGSIAIFTEEGVLVTPANVATVLDDVKFCYIAVGNQQSGVATKSMSTVPFPRAGKNISYKKQAYVTPVKQKKFIGNDGSTGSLNMPTAAAGNILAVKITNTTAGMRTIGAVDEQEVFRYEYVMKSGESNTTAITNLIAVINEDLGRIVNAVVVGSQVGISLETVDYGVTFEISLDEALQNANVYQTNGTAGNSVAINYGVGTEDQVRTLEDLYSVERGHTNRLYLETKYYSNTSLVTSAETYVMYTISWDGDRSVNGSGRQDTNHFEIVVAIPDGSSLATSFETIMAEMFGGVYTTSDVESGS